MSAKARSQRGWSRLAAAGLGVFAGLGGFTFFYAEGTSYFLDDPRACVNCHIMREQYDGWLRSSHHAVATCNDCHTPENLVGKLATKAVNGWNHSAAFTTGRFGDPIQIRGFNAAIARRNCVRCHGDMVAQMRAQAWPEEVDCVHCHGNVGHSNRY